MDFRKPYAGTAIGKLLKLVYGGVYQFEFQVAPLGGAAAHVYYTKRIWGVAGVVGQTWGEIIFILDSEPSNPWYHNILTHEFVHVWQSRQAGYWGFRFLFKYLWYALQHKYADIPYEVQARDLALQYTKPQ